MDLHADQIAQAQRELRATHAWAVEVIRFAALAGEAVAAFGWATELRAVMAELRDEDAALRDELATQIRNDEALSLAQLAERVRVSKPWAQQMIEAHRRRQEEHDDG